MRTRVKQSGGAILALVCCATAALADGASAPAADLALTSTDWSGVYVGVQGGGGFGETGWTFPVDSFFTLFDGNKSFNAVASGGIMGGHVTLNHQIGSLVIGAELLVSAAEIERERTGPDHAGVSDRPLHHQYRRLWYIGGSPRLRARKLSDLRTWRLRCWTHIAGGRFR